MGTDAFALYAIRVQLIKCFGSRFSPTDDRPRKPVPIVIVGARFVSMPDAPRLLPTFTETRRTRTAAEKAMMV